MRIDGFISFGLEIMLSIHALIALSWLHSGLTDLLRSTAIQYAFCSRILPAQLNEILLSQSLV
ncbi:hypothetical protein C0Z16_29150 [Paraburkholderia rhynchosiae]|uniref:Uncharacterized protein n=2 Tax=Paraburkholderia rhynchosiae TaxID=487049 RepID=A0ABX4UWT3_9BURK|nr:hypothetical protein C0Z16_29150 [Paraburkholderia rhynchosiae]